MSAYIADPRVRAVTLTGSDRAGAAVGEQASRNIKPVVLELGGSDAFIVLDSANAAKAAAVAATCRLAIGGQVCVSPKRVIVTEAVADEFIAKYAQRFAEPAVLTGITPEMRIFTEEAFGPLGMIYRVPDADAAVALANSTKYGLGGTVYGEDLHEARRVAGRLDTGAVSSFA